ncbi:hypothetical protein K438DRAFT_1763649 [Mycena galopus ATCC 62051]|nr:hypothetical protein K438DRAFT_1763649 [Mycena galopus ATCC 62051]
MSGLSSVFLCLLVSHTIQWCMGGSNFRTWQAIDSAPGTTAQWEVPINLSRFVVLSPLEEAEEGPGLGPPPVTVTAMAVVLMAVFLDFKHLTGRDGQRDGRHSRKNGNGLCPSALTDPFNHANAVGLNLGNSAIICGLCRISQKIVFVVGFWLQKCGRAFKSRKSDHPFQRPSRPSFNEPLEAAKNLRRDGHGTRLTGAVATVTGGSPTRGQKTR